MKYELIVLIDIGEGELSCYKSFDLKVEYFYNENTYGNHYYMSVKNMPREEAYFDFYYDLRYDISFYPDYKMTYAIEWAEKYWGNKLVRAEIMKLNEGE